MIDTTLSLQLIEIFASVQGESSFTGLFTTFIRLAACNLRCSWCDTTYSFGRGTKWLLQDILQEVKQKGCPYICITGGEPLLQPNVYPLMHELCNQKYILSIETGGSLCTKLIDPRVKIILDIKCPGSGMSDKNAWENLSILRPHDEVKFVLTNEEDYLFAKTICEQYELYKRVAVLFSPVHNVLCPRGLVDWILRDQLPVRLNLQLHKYIWEPATRGV